MSVLLIEHPNSTPSLLYTNHADKKQEPKLSQDSLEKQVPQMFKLKWTQN